MHAMDACVPRSPKVVTIAAMAIWIGVDSEGWDSLSEVASWVTHRIHEIGIFLPTDFIIKN